MSLKRNFTFIMLGISLIIVSYLFYKIYSGIIYKNEIARKRGKLPDLCFYNLDGEKLCPARISNGNSTVIMFFDSECHYCIYGIGSIIKNAGSFTDTNILLISDQPVKLLRRFSEKYKLYKYPQIEILYEDYGVITSVFGTITIPQTFIYCKDHNLLKIFRGEVSAETILKYN
ncbi:MAG: redoxin domain-containing protein [Bacteroidales bacterium]|nr:MAG: redoxin domain-containing protein [Bacteroidales bacterium]